MKMSVCSLCSSFWRGGASMEDGGRRGAPDYRHVEEFTVPGLKGKHKEKVSGSHRKLRCGTITPGVSHWGPGTGSSGSCLQSAAPPGWWCCGSRTWRAAGRWRPAAPAERRRPPLAGSEGAERDTAWVAFFTRYGRATTFLYFPLLASVTF